MPNFIFKNNEMQSPWYNDQLDHYERDIELDYVFSS